MGGEPRPEAFKDPAHAASGGGGRAAPGGTQAQSPVATLPVKAACCDSGGGRPEFEKAKGTLTVGPGRNRVLNTYKVTLPSLQVA